MRALLVATVVVTGIYLGMSYFGIRICSDGQTTHVSCFPRTAN